MNARCILSTTSECTVRASRLSRCSKRTMKQLISLWYTVRLSNQAVNCEFGTTKNEQIRDQVIDKCKSTELWRKLLVKGQELTLTETQHIA